MRLNARLDDELARKVEFLKETTQESYTDILKKALNLYYEQVSAGKSKPIDLIRKNLFVGCGEAVEDLSKNYKQHLREGLGEKLDYR